jgi:hypothetical protein
MSYIKDHIQTTNIVDELQAWISAFVQRMHLFGEVEGIVLLSGVAKRDARPVADIFSDIDLAVFLNEPQVPLDVVDLRGYVLANQEKLPKWLPDYEFHIPVGNGIYREVNLHQMLYSYESRAGTIWSDAKKEAYAYTSRILYDKQGRIEQLISSKTVYDFVDRKNRLCRIAVQMPWYGWLNPERQLQRGFPVVAHYLLNEAIDLLVEGIYLINARFMPHPKWRLLVVDDLPWKPANFLANLSDILVVHGYSRMEIIQRMEKIKDLWDYIIDHALQEGIIPSDYEHYVATHISQNRQLRVRTLADEIVSVVKEILPGINSGHLRSFLDMELFESPSQFLHHLTGPDSNCPDYLVEDWKQLRPQESALRNKFLDFNIS